MFGSAGDAGTTFRQPLLAATLHRLADGGRDAYYGGEIGEEIARAVGAAGGVLTLEDLVAHRGDWVDPISTLYHGVEVATMPPNSQGITALMALNVLEALDWPCELRLHAQIEASKVAWSERDRCVADSGSRSCGHIGSCCRTSTRAGWRRGCRRMRRIGSLRRTRRVAGPSTCARLTLTG